MPNIDDVTDFESHESHLVYREVHSVSMLEFILMQLLMLLLVSRFVLISYLLSDSCDSKSVSSKGWG